MPIIADIYFFINSLLYSKNIPGVLVFLKTISNLLVAEVCVRELGLLNDFMLCSLYEPYIKTEFIFYVVSY